MIFQVGYSTDIGIRKKVNQDSLCIKKAKTERGCITMAVLCDGMGGLAYGEVASATVVRAFSKWFEQELPKKWRTATVEMIEQEWLLLVRELNEKLWKYGNENNVQLGTTVTAVLILEDGKYIIVHVGDSRIYRIKDHSIEQLTEDQTLVAREVKKGIITKEQASTDPRRNVLLQCIGGSKNIEAKCRNGNAFSDEMFLLCSDGFRHKMTETEMLASIWGKGIKTESEIKEVLELLIQRNKERGETDNISAILIKTH